MHRLDVPVAIGFDPRGHRAVDLHQRVRRVFLLQTAPDVMLNLTLFMMASSDDRPRLWKGRERLVHLVGYRAEAGRRGVQLVVPRLLVSLP